MAKTIKTMTKAQSQDRKKNEEVWKSVEYYWEFLRVGTTFDIFQNIILIPYLEYGVLSFSRYRVLVIDLLWSLVSAGTDMLLDGYGVLVFKIDGDEDEDERMTMRDYVCGCLGEAMRVWEEMKDIGLKARIAKEVEANHKRIQKELEKKDVDYSKKTHNYFVQNEGENVSSDTASHSTMVIDNIKNRLMSTTKELKLVLTMRTEGLVMVAIGLKALRLTRARYCDLLAKCDMVTEGNSFSQSGGRRNMSRKSMKKSKGGEYGGTSGESYGQDGYSEYHDGFAAPHMSFLRYLTMLQYRFSGDTHRFSTTYEPAYLVANKQSLNVKRVQPGKPCTKAHAAVPDMVLELDTLLLLRLEEKYGKKVLNKPLNGRSRNQKVPQNQNKGVGPAKANMPRIWILVHIESMLRKCHGHGLTKGAIIQIFYRGLDEPTQAILDGTARGIFLYKTPNQAF
ncbi:hypothetical protein Tco_0822820 [Tanacetum coccineum]|uniref:Uncharacterized protein n=1 Tax=Tanacetum coccineum TaxID=301880 RepID=A0ABQ5AKA8_9ASTR